MKNKNHSVSVPLWVTIFAIVFAVMGTAFTVQLGMQGQTMSWIVRNLVPVVALVWAIIFKKPEYYLLAFSLRFFNESGDLIIGFIDPAQSMLLFTIPMMLVEAAVIKTLWSLR